MFLQCKRHLCEYKWTTKKQKKPKVCPSCKSKFWDIDSDEYNIHIRNKMYSVKRERRFQKAQKASK